MTELPKTHGAASFTIAVLWLHGSSVGSIAVISGRTTGSIRGIVNRTFETPRDQMTIEDRQAILDKMRGDRKDEGKLSERFFHALPLKETQKPAKAKLPERDGPLIFYKPKEPKPEPLPEPDPRTRQGRKEIQRRKQEQQRKDAAEARGRAEREQGGNPRRGPQGSALEYLYGAGTLADPQQRSVDSPRQGLSSRDRRKEAGLILRGLMDLCRVGGLNTVDLERVGRGGFGIAIPARRLEAIHALGAIKKMMEDRDFELIERVVDRDEFVWEGIPSSKAKSLVYDAIRRSLDIVAVAEELMAREAFETRWGYALPVVKPIDWDDAVAMSRKARELLREGQRTS